MKITKANKAIISGFATIGTALVAVSADNVIDMNEQQHLLVTVLTAAFGVWAVYRVPNAKDEE